MANVSRGRIWGVGLLTATALGLSACGGNDKSSAGPTDTGTPAGTPGINVSPRRDLATDEAGTSTRLTITLGSQPTQNVVLVVTSLDPGEVAVAPGAASLVFTSADWSAPRSVTLTGVDDDERDGPQVVTVRVDPTTSADPAYAGLAPVEVTVTNADDDTPAIAVTPTSLSTEEGGAPATFTVALAAAPAAGKQVVVSVSSGDTSEGTISPAQLTFDGSNWTEAQTVTVTPADDVAQDGDQTYAITLDLGASTDSGYAAVSGSVAVTNSDNDTPGLRLTPATLSTAENGAPVSFTVRPRSALAAGETVSLAITSGDVSEGDVSPATLTFDSTNWATAQAVTVTPADDSDADGRVTYAISLDPSGSTAAAYAALGAQVVTVTNADDERASIQVSPRTLSTREGGDFAEIEVTLGARPPADTTVVLAVNSGDPSEGTVSPSTLSFDSTNWSTPRTIAVFPVDDTQEDQAQSYTITIVPVAGSAAAYAALPPVSVAVVNADNDGPIDLAGLQPYQAALAAGEERVFSLPTVVGETYTVSLVGLSGPLGLAVADERTFSNPLCMQQPAGSMPRVCEATASGSVLYIGVGAGEVAASCYILVSRHASALPFTAAAPPGASFWMLPVAGGGRYQVSITTSGAAYVYIYPDAMYQEAACGLSTSNGAASCQLVLGESSFFLEVTNEGSQAIEFTVDAQPYTIEPTTVSAPFTGTIESRAWGYYDVAVPAGDTYIVSLTGLEQDVDLFVFADAQFTEQLCNSERGGTSDESCTVTASGEHLYVGVFGWWTMPGQTSPFVLDVYEYVAPAPSAAAGTGP